MSFTVARVEDRLSDHKRLLGPRASRPLRAPLGARDLARGSTEPVVRFAQCGRDARGPSNWRASRLSNRHRSREKGDIVLCVTTADVECQTTIWESPRTSPPKLLRQQLMPWASRPRKQGKTPTNSWRKCLRLKKSPKTRTGNPDNWFLFRTMTVSEDGFLG